MTAKKRTPLAAPVVAPVVAPVACFDPRALYIGRGSPWGNPYRIASGLSRTEALRLYEQHARDTLWGRLHLLTGRKLVCPGDCTPKPCHGHVLVKLWKERFA